MSGSVRAAVGSVMKLDRATVIASCANSRGRFVDVRREVDAPLAARGDVLEELGVGIGLAAQPDHARR